MITRFFICTCVMLMFAHGADAQLNDQKVDKPDLPIVEAVSLLGQPLRRAAIPAEHKQKLQQQLAAAEKNLAENPGQVEQVIWVGRRLAYLWRYNDAVEVFSQGIKDFPSEPKLYRHRGHRYITLRKFDLAIADLSRAAQLIKDKLDEVEPDGMPNAAGIPTSTLQTNIWYHLGLAYYLNRDYQLALAAFEKCLAACKNNDMKVATLDWMYMTLRRLGRNDEAKERIAGITPDLKIIENTAYHRRLMMYRGIQKPDDLIPENSAGDRDLDLATYGYGVGCWYQLNGQNAKATEIYEKVVAGNHWAAFGYIAAEAELAHANSK